LLGPVFAVALTGFLVYQYAWNALGARLAALQEENRQMSEEILDLEAERRRLHEQLAVADRSAQIDTEAAKQLRGELKVCQDREMKLEQELTFLRGIVSSGVKQEVLQIQGFRLETLSEAKREYRYRFTVSKALTDTGYAAGWISLALDGMVAGEHRTLAMKEITPGGIEKVKMRFRNFQDIEGIVRLPEGFEPQDIVLQITPTTKKLSPVSKRLTWRVADRGETDG